MKKIASLLCTAAILAGASADDNLASAAQAANWRFNGAVPPQSMSMTDLKPAGKDRVVNIDYTFPQPFDVSPHESFNLRMKITAPAGSVFRLKVNFYSQGGYLYSRVMPVRQAGDWEDFEFLFQSSGKSAPAARKDFDLAQVRRVRIAVLAENTENIGVEIARAAFGKSRKLDSAQVQKQLDLLGGNPLVSSVFTAEAPVIDGKLDDGCWRRAIRLTGFHQNKGGPAEEQTEVRLCHDDRNLYIGVKAYADVLSPVNNLLHEFKESVTEHDGPVYNDDCIELFFAGKSGQYGQIVANLHATFERIVSPAGSDPSWNPPIQLKGHKQIGPGGYYSIELAISLSELERFKDDRGKLTFNAARQNQYRKELSNWSRASSFHRSEQYADLVFGKTLPGLEFTGDDRPANLPVIHYECHGKPEEGLRIALQMVFSPTQNELQTAPIQPGKHSFSAAGDTGNFLYSLLVLSDGEIVYRSPLENFGAGLAVAAGQVLGNGTVHVNGQPVGQDGKISLVKGKNTIAVQLPAQPQFSIRIDGQEPLTPDAGWKFSETAPEGWTRPGFDDSSWAPADGKSLRPGCLRKVIMTETTRFFPLIDEQNKLRAPQGAVQPFSLIINGVKGEELNDYRFYLELPEQVEFAGASAQMSERFGGPRARWRKVGNTVNSGKPYIRYEVTFAGNTPEKPGTVRYVPPEKLYHMGDLVVLALKTETPGDFDCYYYAAANNGNYTELKRRFGVQVLPALSSATPARMRMLTWFSFRKLDDKELQLRIYREHARAGFNIANADSGMGEIVKSTGMKYCSRFNFEKNGFDPTAVLAQYPSVRFIDPTGNLQPYKVPFYHIVHNEKLRGDLGAALRQYLTAIKPDILDWDFEFDNFTGFYTSYDSDTLEFFRRQYRISGELNPQIIHAKYASEWVEFMTRLTGEVFRFIHENTKSLGIEFDVYSGYPSAHTRIHYGIDYEYVLPNVDFAMMGYGRPMKEIQEARRLSEKFNRPILFGVCARPYFLYQVAPRQPITPAQVLRLVLDCGYGAMYWGHYCSDGELLHAFNEINRLLAAYEDVILDGVNVPAESVGTFTGIDPEDVSIYRQNGKTLLLLLNPGDKPKSVKITFKNQQASKMKEFYSTKPLNAVNGEIHLSLQPGQVAALVEE